jgi:hypothetical protein
MHHDRLLPTLLPIIAKPLLNAIILLDTRLILTILTCHETLRAFLALDRQLCAELNLARATLGKFEYLVLDHRGAIFLLVLAGSEWALPCNDIGSLRIITLACNVNG